MSNPINTPDAYSPDIREYMGVIISLEDIKHLEEYLPIPFYQQLCENIEDWNSPVKNVLTDLG